MTEVTNNNLDVTARYNLMFCHQYPTGACVTGNGEVRSLRENVSSSRGMVAQS
jgi:hypothetical protein